MTNHPNRKIKMTGGTATTHKHAANVECSITHGGNRRLYRVGRDNDHGFECAGCGKNFSAEWVIGEQAERAAA